MDRETLIDVARTSLRTKVHAELADVLTEVCVELKPLILKTYNFNYRVLSKVFTVPYCEISRFIFVATITQCVYIKKLNEKNNHITDQVIKV